ncbi:MAG: chemotaxis protein CheW [Cyanobacteria bacterium J06638_38]
MTSELAITPKPSLTKALPAPKEQFLMLDLAPATTALLATEKLTEVLSLSPEQIMPIPHMSPWMMGTYNWRGEILWLIDASYLVGLTPLYQQLQTTSGYTLVVMQFNTDGDRQTLGLVVNQIGNIEKLSLDSLQSTFSANQTRWEKFLRGYWLKPEGAIIAVLDSVAIWQEISGF